jgi:hypothetical protein
MKERWDGRRGCSQMRWQGPSPPACRDEPIHLRVFLSDLYV